MKKLTTAILITFTLLLSACSNKTNQDDVLTFFHAFNETLNVNSAHIKGTFTSHSDQDFTTKIDFQFNQEKQINLALDIDLEAGNQFEDQFLSFYIKDGKTYLNSLGTTSQSLANKIGIDKNYKISVSNPFLDYTDEELKTFFDSSKRENDEYTFQINTKKLENFLDPMATIQIEDAVLKSTIKDNTIHKLSIKITGVQNIEDQQAIIDIDIHCTINDINKLKQIDFPKNLENY